VKKKCLITAALAFTSAATFAATNPQPVQSAPLLKPCTSVTIDPPTKVVLGKSTVVKLSMPAYRMVVGGLASGRSGKPVEATDKNAPPPPPMAAVSLDGVADVDMMLLSPTELFFLGKRAGSMNVVLQSSEGQCVVKDLIVTIDPQSLQSKLAEVMPDETGIKVIGAENALILTGNVRDAVQLDLVMNLATSYGDGKRVVNMLRTNTPQQVMLEVKIAEVSKTLLDRLGANVTLSRMSNGGENTYSLLSNFLSGGGGLLEALKVGKTLVSVDGQKDDGLVRVLAEPNIMSISGQPSSFLSGGKIFIPVAQSNGTGGSTITLEEKEFGIGVKFTPTVLDGTRINLKLTTEVSDLIQAGNPFTSVNGITSILPAFNVRRADTTVQLNDGQSFVIAGLIKNNVTETVKRYPGLGEIPVLGALFRSTEFQKQQTELLFIVTPRLVKPLSEVPILPTDNHVEPSRMGVYFNGALEGN
jgi:pilus assembly protein CpaC